MKRTKSVERFLSAFGQAIRETRTLRGYSQEELEFRCKLDRTYISGVERGVRNPTIMIVLKLARALKTTPSKLMHAAEDLDLKAKRESRS